MSNHQLLIEKAETIFIASPLNIHNMFLQPENEMSGLIYELLIKYI